MKYVLVNYNFTPNWVKDLDYLIYDRSDDYTYLKGFDQDKIIYTKNLGNVDCDRLGYLVDNYDNLPSVFLWSKSNLFKYITKEEFDVINDNKEFTPLLTQKHRIYSNEQGVVCYYKDNMYYEVNNGWYLQSFPARCGSFEAWAKMFNLPNPDYIPFAPGGNYILTKEVIHKHPKELYVNMRDTLDYTVLPGEAQLCERSYFLLWS